MMRASVAAVAMIGVLALAGSVITGCSCDSHSASTVTDHGDKEAVQDPNVPTVWPLTGKGGKIVVRPAATVKIENSAAARPQAGLEQADIVWEELVEGGVTRFAAMYNSQVPKTVGPVRSVRPMDAGIAASAGGLIAFSGGQPRFIKQVARAGLQIISHDGGNQGFTRDRSRRAPHNVYGSVPAFLRQADAAHRDAPQQVFTYPRGQQKASAPDVGMAATILNCVFSTSSRPGWTWNVSSSRWERDESGRESYSTASKRLSAVNVVVMRVKTKDTGVVDGAGSRVPETIMTGSGPVYVATGGHIVEGTWSKANAKAPVVLRTKSGDPIMLAVGSTWVELVPASGSFSWE